MAKAKILLVDDSRSLVELLSLRLEANDYEVVTATIGLEALDKAKGDKPDLILLDIAMPGMDGFEVGRKLKEDVQTQQIPVIMVTAKAMHDDISKAFLEAGAAAYVVKPFRPELLLEKIEIELKQRG